MTTFTVYPFETDGQSILSTPRFVQAISLTGGAGTNYFQLVGDLTYRFVSGFQFTVQLSGDADGVYTVAPANSSYSGGLTTIPVVETIPGVAALPYGQIVYSIPATTSLALPGKGNVNYGENLVTDFVHLLENAASTTAPTPATRGQLWFNTSTNTLMVYDGVVWLSAATGPSGTVIGGNSTGLSNDSTVYNATVTVDGTPIVLAITGSTAQTFSDLISEINTTLGAAATADILSGNIQITSSSTGLTSTVLITDGGAPNLFSSTTGFSSILGAVDGYLSKIVQVLDPTNAQDVATKSYVDAGKSPDYEYHVGSDALAGQFTLSSITYTPGSYRLVIFVNGVKQVYPPNGNYTEDDSTHVTFSPALSASDQVEFYHLY